MFDKWRARRAEARRVDGFAWAMSAFYLEHKEIHEIEDYLFNPFEDSNEDFNKGAYQAVQILKTTR